MTNYYYFYFTSIFLSTKQKLIYIYIYIYILFLLIGLTNTISLDDLITCTRPPWHNTDEHRRAINKSIQHLG